MTLEDTRHTDYSEEENFVFESEKKSLFDEYKDTAKLIKSVETKIDFVNYDLIQAFDSCPRGVA